MAIAPPNFQSTVRNWLISEMNERHVTRKALAQHLNLNASAVTRLLRGERQISGEDLIRAATMLGFPASFNDMMKTLMPGAEVDFQMPQEPSVDSEVEEQQPSRMAEQNFSIFKDIHGSKSELRRTMPLMMSSKGDLTCDFYINLLSERWIERPPGLSSLTHSVATKARGEALAPRHRDGEVMFLANARTLDPGNDVVVEVGPSRGQSNGVPVRVGTILSVASDSSLVLQHGNGQEIEIPANEILSVFWILDWNSVHRAY